MSEHDRDREPAQAGGRKGSSGWEPTFSPKYTMQKGVGGFASLYKENRKKPMQSADNVR